MATHDYNIANQTGADFRADLNNALLAIVSNNSNATSPSTTYAYQLWVDTANNVLKLRNSANSDWITTGISITASNSFTGDITGNSATATALATARTINGVSFDGTANISFNTDSVNEGSSNLYFTNERVDDQVNSLLTAGSGISLTYDDAAGTLTIANTNSADITSVVAGDGLTGGGTSGDVTLAVSVDDSSIEINSDTLRVKASGITNAMLAGSIANSKLANSSVTINSQAIALGGSHTFDSDDIGEGSSNLYFTNARARGSLSIGSEGSASGNGAIAYNSSTGVFTYTPPVISGLTGDTDDLSEGSSNLYYTDARANSAIDARVTQSFVNALNIQAASVAANSVALGNDTTGNYVATIADAGNSRITVANSGSETAAVTLDIADDAIGTDQLANNAVALGTQSTGNYVATVAGTTNEIEVSGSGSETASVTIGLPDNVTIAGNLTVNGTTTSVNTQTLEVEDPLIKLAKDNSGADSVDIGFYGLYDTSGSQDLYAGLFRDASDSGKFKLFKDLQAEPTTTVNTSGTGYAVGTLVSNLEGDVTGNVTGNVSGTAATVTGAAQTNITSLGTLTGLTTTGDINLGDDDKVLLGASSDLQIFHDGSDSFIKDEGQGNLRISSNGAGVEINKQTSEYMIRALTDGAVELYHNNSKKLETTSSGVDVTGTLTATTLAGTLSTAAQPNITSLGTLTTLTVDDITINGSTISDAGILTITTGDDFSVDAEGDISLDANGGDIRFKDNGTVIGQFTQDASNFVIKSAVSDEDLIFRGNDGGSEITALTLDMSDAGSAYFNNKVGIGTASPDYALHVTGSGDIVIAATAGASSIAGLNLGNSTNKADGGIRYDNSSDALIFRASNTERMRIDSSGNLGIGTTSPSFKLHVDASGSGVIAGFFNDTDTTSEEALLQVGGTLTDNYGVMFGAKPEVDTPAVQDHAFIVKTNDSTGTDHIERFRISSDGNVGIGTTSPAMELDVRDDGASGIATIGVRGGTSGAGSIQISGNGTTYGSTSFDLIQNSAGAFVQHRANLPLIFATNDTERMRIDSSGNALFTKSGGAYLQLKDASAVRGAINVETSDGLVFTTGSSFTERMRINSSGNVGLGTTSPTANRRLHIVSTAQNQAKFERSGAATSHIEFDDSTTSNQPSMGGVGDNLTFNTAFTERCRIDSSGNLGLGTASPSKLLHIKSADPVIRLEDSSPSAYAEIDGAGGDLIINCDAGDDDANSVIKFKVDNSEKMRVDSNGDVAIGTTGGNGRRLEVATANDFVAKFESTDAGSAIIIEDSNSTDNGNRIGVTTNDMHFTTNSSERLRIDSSGNIGIGTISAASKLHIDGAEDSTGGITLTAGAQAHNWYLASDFVNVHDIGTGSASAAHTWHINGSEKVRIDASGNLLINTTANQGVGGYTFEKGGLGITTHNNNNGASGGYEFSIFRRSSVQIGSIAQNGTTGVQYNTSSDARLKDVTGSSRGLDVINNLNPVAYNWKADGKADEGLIAQEVEEIVPNAVSQTKDGYYQMDYSKLVTHLVKGMQEQQEQIESLKSEIANLKGE